MFLKIKNWNLSSTKAFTPFVEAPLAALTFKTKCTAEQNVQKGVNIIQ